MDCILLCSRIGVAHGLSTTGSVQIGYDQEQDKKHEAPLTGYHLSMCVSQSRN